MEKSRAVRRCNQRNRWLRDSECAECVIGQCGELSSPTIALSVLPGLCRPKNLGNFLVEPLQRRRGPYHLR